MDYQEWEFFETEIDSRVYTVVDQGPLHGPVTSYVVRRNRHLDLVLETTSAADGGDICPESVANRVFTADDEVQWQGLHGGATVTARGVIPLEYQSTLSAEDHTVVQTSTIQSLHWTNSYSGKAQYVMDWIGNLSGRFMWPDFDDVEETERKSRTLQSARGEIVIPLTSTSEKHSRSCARLSVGGWDVVIGQSRAKPEHVKDPGFILYLGLPDDETRSRIRQCLSFCLGDYLIHLGDTTFDTEWKPTSFFVRAGHALVEDALDISGRPPAPLGMRFEYEIDAALLGQMASGLFEAYDSYNLRNAFWNYWHAIAAPVHMAAAHFGAAIEALQRTYFAQTGTALHSRIVTNEDAWQELYTQINQCIQDSALSSDEKRMLSNKAQHLNSAPQGILADRFFAAIGLNVSALERDVWMNRNRAAHGGGIAEDRAIQTIRENKVLRTLTNRILLSISRTSESYYDYYSLNRPVRELSEPVPDDRPPRAS